MKTLDEVRTILAQKKEKIYQDYGVRILGIFGSYSRGEQSITSDIDLLIEIDRPIGLKFYELWEYLENLLECRVDLVRANLVREELRDSIFEGMVML
ncbi:MAG: nucleotidyltransferase family protein [Ignavibacteria bacterium]|jgi:predicted nucleotidyltransferase|nr:nucleotidyltransferase family protein [Ignavibacteria bacterium]MDH7528815.1 nucleotidyltransferase family protein [Ignavibacteria bacterium]